MCRDLPKVTQSEQAVKFGFDRRLSASKPVLFPLHSRPHPLNSPLSYPFLPPFHSRGRPAPPLPSLSPSHPPSRWWRRQRRSHVVGPGSRGRGALGRLPQLGSAALRRAALGAFAPRSALRASRPGAGGAPGCRPVRQRRRGSAERARGWKDHGLRAQAARLSPEDPALPGPALGARPRRPGRPKGRTRSPRGAEDELEGRRGGRPARPLEPWASAAGAARLSPSAACSW